MQVTLWRDLAAPIPPRVPLPAGLAVVPCEDVALEPLSAVYFACARPPHRPPTLAAARAEMAATFDGEYGELLPLGSLAVVHEASPVAVIQTVRRAPWPDVQRGPFIIELFTDAAWRRRGLARHLLLRALEAAVVSAEQSVGLRADDGNAPAIALYRSLQFQNS